MERADIFKECMKIQAEGYNCAESVVMMAGKYFLKEMPIPWCNFVTGFGGGIGRSREETCGALTGAVLALSIAFGRSDAEVDVNPTHELVSEFRKMFLDKFGDTICKRLREGLEGDEAKSMCQNMTAETVLMLFELFEANGVVPE